MDIETWVKRPVEVEAMRWDGTAAGANPIIDWALSHGWTINYDCVPGEDGFCTDQDDMHYLTIRTLEGNMTALAGYYIIRGVEGEFYGCEPNIFHKTYGPA